MPRYPHKPETWKPTESTIYVEGVGEVHTVATFDRAEPDGTGKHYAEPRGPWVENLRTYWNVKLTFEGAEISTTFNQGSAFTAPPKAEDVLGCLVMDAGCATGTFEDFCSDLGYDSDSRTAERTYHACQKTELDLRRIFGGRYDILTKWGETQ